MFTAKVICDSIANKCPRITTFQLRYPKFIHGELMTHRVFSRNASSSRAIPTPKYLEEVRSDELRASPIEWGKNMPGMQAKVLLEGEELQAAKDEWKAAALAAADIAESMSKRGVHKQIVNRILEPFIHINVVVTSTEYMNFFGLRLDADAQPEIQELAKNMWIALNDSTPNQLEFGDWHLPYIRDEEKQLDTMDKLQISTARCGRVSYLSFESGKVSTSEEDRTLFKRLISRQPIHASPAEHQATPECGNGPYQPSQWGNFHMWKQHRKIYPHEGMAPLPDKYDRRVVY